jgi:egghead protein (zeste-white 4 protein)
MNAPGQEVFSLPPDEEFVTSRQRQFRKQLPATLRYSGVVLLPTSLFCVSISAGWISVTGILQPHDSDWRNILYIWVLVSLATHFLVSIFGMLRYGSPAAQNTENIINLRADGWSADKRLVFCFVSQGIQEAVLKNSVENAVNLARALDVRFDVEVVVDTRVPQDPYFLQNNCSIIVVPPSFETPNRSLFKARALCYASAIRSESREDLRDTWVLHLDEDTLIAESTIAGIHEHLSRADSDRACGAGEIKYNAVVRGRFDIFSFMDCHRTGEDVGRFRLQFAGYGAALFGAHGSFLLVPARLEAQVDFDFGPCGSIAEDIYFALRLRELGIPCRWIQGYVREQSPLDPGNFLRQRARWIHGLLNGCFDRTFSWKRRATLLLYLMMWRTTIVSGLVLTVLVIFNGGSERLAALFAMSMLVVGTNSWVGALRNMEEDGPAHMVRRVMWLALSILFVPLVCLFETIAVVLGVVCRPRGFFVVRKALPRRAVQGIPV